MLGPRARFTFSWRLLYDGRVRRQFGEALTARQREVLALMAAGRGNREIAAELGISLSTVKTHVENILRVMGAENRTEAAALLRADELAAPLSLPFEKRSAVAVLRFDGMGPDEEHFSAGVEFYQLASDVHIAAIARALPVAAPCQLQASSADLRTAGLCGNLKPGSGRLEVERTCLNCRTKSG